MQSEGSQGWLVGRVLEDMGCPREDRDDQLFQGDLHG